MGVTAITSVSEFESAIGTKENIIITFTLKDSRNAQNDSCEAIYPLLEELSGKSEGLKFYKVFINETPDVAQKAGVDMMVLPAYKVYKDGKGPVKTAQGPDPKDLFDLVFSV
ncbi:hypothetical protein P170DRAFT_508065 [Aspergillus steynii IBT 23096]|uniref:Thioredoxin domain-containing protein n=1 Tax=Aspergillus steynii IBT 23096 TaxID=1392250 RepID=A0A2I2GKM8_9EURO|nr:uncharacterized protein P170DRAFT_508065 [Aspergillus steynii IBT 23096]PLB53443.1 hypothetical protein P170DRAFT_508065 [Aspergillus steynii IBT 23096]